MTPAAGVPRVPSAPRPAGAGDGPVDPSDDPAGLGLGTLDRGWDQALTPVRPRLRELSHWLAEQPEWLPAPENVLRAFRQPFADVRVLVVGQDPYPTPGHPVGLSFAVERHVRPLPRSLVNVYKELGADVGVVPPEHGDLTAWTRSGVLLLNRLLTVGVGASGSHRRRGWEEVTATAVQALAAREAPLVAVLWGRDAQTLIPLLGDVAVVHGVHPSPLSASRGFFGSRPFSAVDALLREQGVDGVDWSLDTVG